MSHAPPGWYPDPDDRTHRRWWDGIQWTSRTAPGEPATKDTAVSAYPSHDTPRFLRWGQAAAGALLLIVLVLVSPLALIIAPIVFITALVSARTGKRTWLVLNSRRAALIVSFAAVAMMIAAVVDSTVALVSESTDAERSDYIALVDESIREEPVAPAPPPTPVVETREEVVVEQIPFERITNEDATIPRGESLITQNGQNGQRTLTYLVTFVDGDETTRTLLSDVVTVAPIPEVTAIGILDPEPQGGCDPNYADGCVPIASDVDCAGGSGNGPAYFDGVARVVGIDIYDLDRDGDGLACES